MKKSKFVYLLILPFVIFSCSSFDKFDHFGVGNTFEESFEVVVPEGTVTSFEGAASFDASDDKTLEDNIDNISAFEVTRLSLKITKVNATKVMAEGQVNITSDGKAVGDAINMNLDLSSDKEVVLEVNPNTFAAIKEAYLSKRKIKVTASGSISDTPIDVEFTIYMSIEATIENVN